MAWTSQDLATLDAAIATGAKVVRFSDRTLEYQSTKEMMEARTTIANFLSASTSPAPIRQIRVWGNKGF